MLMVAFFSTANGQQNNFIYLQTENNLPYEAFWNGTVYPSSSGGYLLIPKVPTGEQVLNISFSPDISAPYTFTIMVDDKSRGFSLRQSVDNSWSLFDMVDFSLTRGTILVTTIPPEPVKIQTPVAKAEPPIRKKEKPVTPTNIEKIFDKAGSDGIEQVYILINGEKADTIAVFIPILIETANKQSATNPSSFLFQLSPENREHLPAILTASISLFKKEYRTRPIGNQ
jgi:hypothetical protein